MKMIMRAKASQDFLKGRRKRSQLGGRIKKVFVEKGSLLELKLQFFNIVQKGEGFKPMFKALLHICKGFLA